MSKSKKIAKFKELIKRDKEIIFISFLFALLFIGSSLMIYYYAPADNAFQLKIADLLMTVGETIIGIGLIGGVINFIFEELKAEEEALKEKQKEYQENKEKRKAFRRTMQHKLQCAHDNVELARVFIKSHKSGRTYGEQIREHIMPSMISLKDFKRELNHIEDRQLKKNLDCLKVSLTYMIAYLRVIIEEFEASYLEISNLQTYQDALANKMRISFAEVAEGKKGENASVEKKKEFLETAEKLFANIDVPSYIEVVWQAMQELDYVWDFIDDLRNEKGEKSLYYKYFLEHYFHCNKIIKTKDSSINQKLTTRKSFVKMMEELNRIEEKKNSDSPLTKHDSLTRKIMETELNFDFETSKMKQ